MTVDDLFALIVVILGIVSAISKNKKKAQKAARKAVKTPAKKAATLEQTLAEWFDEAKTAAQPAPAAPAAKPVTHEGIHPCDEHNSEPVKVVQPRIQTRVQVTEKPQVVLGSMGTDTHEGIHPCDEHDDNLLQPDRPLVPVPVEKPGIQLDWNGDNMVKAFIMQEVLTRPCDRRRRA